MNPRCRLASSRFAVVAALVIVLAGSIRTVHAEEKRERPAAAGDNYDELFAHYLAAARTVPPVAGPDIAWMVGLSGDRRARNVNDLLTVQVIESIAASGTADSTLTKDSKASASAGSMFGLDKALPDWLDPTNLASATSKTDFKGGGTTSRAGQLTATMTVRVAEVLPNGDLVLEGAREIDINGDRQIVVLNGVVRPSDVLPSNVVLSTRVGQLRIRYFGRGLMKDNLRPGWLVRVLNKIF